jgi:rubredoxin
MAIITEKVPGGIMVDGIKLLSGKCGCTSVLKCCHSWSKVKKRGPAIELKAKMTAPDTKDNYNWGYTVRNNGTTVKVEVEDARDKEIYSGYIPPPINEWIAKGWEVVENKGNREDGTVWRCAMCKWLYNDEKEGTPFNDLTDEWKCPKCGAIKKVFERIG